MASNWGSRRLISGSGECGNEESAGDSDDSASAVDEAVEKLKGL